jgi:hypothetical protein
MTDLTILERVEIGDIPDDANGRMSKVYPPINVARALVQTRGNINETAKALGTEYFIIWRKIKGNPLLQEVLEAVREMHGIKLAEMAVDNLEQDLEHGEPWATVQVLNKSKWGQALGFGDRLDITASAKPPEVIEIVRENLIEDITEENKHPLLDESNPD